VLHVGINIEIDVGICGTDRPTDGQLFSSTRHSHGACTERAEREREIERETDDVNFLMGLIIIFYPHVSNT
jgi:hypothetical protein